MTGAGVVRQAAGARMRWAAAGAAVAIIVGATAWVAASPQPDATSFVPIVPCRLMDTRPLYQVGPKDTPLGAGATYTATVWGTNGDCTIPTDATGLSLNVTAVSPTKPSFLTVYPADASRPTASNLNYSTGQNPTPNAVTVKLSADGKMKLYNYDGTVDVIVDIVGYYRGTGTAHVVTVAPTGGDFALLSEALAAITDSSALSPYVVQIAPGTYTETSPVELKDYVDVRGSGRLATRIVCACAGSSLPTAGTTLYAAGDTHSVVSDLTIENSGGLLA